MKGHPHPDFMRIAIAEARKNSRLMHGGPFGACIVKGQKVLAVSRNTVLVSDASSHAEVNAIRQASKALGTFALEGCLLYSTTEPCPMCFSAIHWAKITTIIYGSSIADVKQIGFDELPISCRRMNAMGKAGMRIVAGFLRDECRLLLDEWARQPQRRLY